MQTPMTQNEFDLRMAEHQKFIAQYHDYIQVQVDDPDEKYADHVKASAAVFEGEDLSEIKALKGWDFGGVIFNRCRFRTLDLSKTNSSHWVSLNHCEGMYITAKDTDNLILQMRHTDIVLAVELDKITALDLSIEDCDLGRFEVTNSKTNVRCKRSGITSSRFKNCTGGGVGYSHVTGEVRFEDNAFNRVRMVCVSSLGIITLPLWEVYFTGDMMKIGCQEHSIESWFGYSDVQIDYMDTRALEWWTKWKPTITKIVNEIAPSLPKTGVQMPTLAEREKWFQDCSTEGKGSGPSGATDPDTLEVIIHRSES